MADTQACPQFIVDSHVHAFSPELIERREQLAETDNWFGELYRNPVVILATRNDLLESMEQGGIDASVMCGFPWSDPGLCREHNAYMAESCASDPARLAWLATVLPHDTSAVDEAERCFRAGAAGIGELNADGQGFDLADPEPLGELVEVCQQYDRPIMFHVSEPLGHRYPGKGTATPDRFVQFLERFPDVRVIAAHWGGGLPFYELMPEVGRVASNVVYDSAATTYLYRSSVFRAAIDLVGADRVMFASDFPVLRQDRLRRRVERLDLPEDAWSRIAGGNAIEVFSLKNRETVHD